MDSATVEKRKIEARDDAYIRSLLNRGVPRMVVWQRFVDAGYDLDLDDLPPAVDIVDPASEHLSHSLRLKPEVIDAIRDIATDLGYVYYMSNGPMGVVPPLLNAIAAGHVKLVVNDGEEPRRLTMSQYRDMNGNIIDANTGPDRE